MALVPPLLETIAPLDATSWRLANLAALVLALGCFGANLWIDLQLRRIGHPAQALVILLSSQGLQLLGLLILAAAVLGWPISAGPAPHAFAVLFYFCSGLSGVVVSFWLSMIEVIRSTSSE